MAGLFLALGFVVLAAMYWAVTGADTVLLREDNPRRVEAEAAILRGNIFDRDDALLAQTTVGTNSTLKRDYLRPEVYGLIGYYSLRYGVGGVESAFDATLRGDALPPDLGRVFTRNVLHQAQHGADVRLTIDLDVQRAALLAMGDHTGAAVVLNANGEVLALVSLPAYNPNALDQRWDALVTAPEQPFFNRALQGRYQPGGVLQTPLMTAALIAGHPVNEVVEQAGRTLTLENLALNGNGESATILESVTLRCATPPPSNRLTLAEAYAFACPGPFADLFQTLGEGATEDTFDLFALAQPNVLAGFTAQPQTVTTADDEAESQTFMATLVPPTAAPLSILDEISLSDALGQGGLTVSPLDMAVLTASIIGGGNAPEPYILLATRAPDQPWARDTQIHGSRPVTTAQVANQLQTMMRAATVSGSARRAARADITVGGHVALAYSGDQEQTWFVGYALQGQNQGVALALVLEDFGDPDTAAEIGGIILEAAYRYNLPDDDLEALP